MGRTRYILAGSCRMTGCCCRDMNLWYDGKPVRTKSQFLKICQEDEDFRRWRFTGRDEHGHATFDCTLLSPDNLCTDYEARPQMCRDYPKVEDREDLKDGCGFYFIKRDGVPKERRRGKARERSRGC